MYFSSVLPQKHAVLGSGIKCFANEASLINKNYGAKPVLIPSGRGKKAGGPTVSRGRRTEHGQPRALDLHQKAWGAKTLNAWCPVKMNEEMFYLHAFYKTVDDEESHIITSTTAAPGEHESQPELFLTCEVYLCVTCIIKIFLKAEEVVIETESSQA